MSGNLPSWNGASVCYSRAYAMLARMRDSGHVTRTQVRGGKFRCYVSPEMSGIIDALNSGNEESIKAILLYSNN